MSFNNLIQLEKELNRGREPLQLFFLAGRYCYIFNHPFLLFTYDLLELFLEKSEVIVIVLLNEEDIIMKEIIKYIRYYFRKEV